jgi:hypothetical protein
LAAAVLIVLAAGWTALPGCSGDSRQVTIVKPEREKREGLTPLERGRIRGEVLRVVRPAIKAWREGDVAAMKRYFSAELATYNAKVKADYARQGKVRVRAHTNVTMDVVELTPDGREASVQYTFRNRSYFAAKSTRRPLTRPADEDGEIDMILKRTDRGWTITRMFSGRDELL